MTAPASQPDPTGRPRTDRTTTIDDLLALPADRRLSLLTALRAGRDGPVVLVSVPMLVRSVADKSAKDGRSDQVE